MSNIIGIDLGTTNSCLAILEHGTTQVLANAEGQRTTPSVISFLEDGEKLVGNAARRQSAIQPTRTITSVKRLLGRRLSEVEEEVRLVPYKVVAGKNDATRIVIDEVEYEPERLSAFILEKLKADAESYLGKPVTEAVITVPAYFNDAQRQATKQSAEIAGLKVLRLVNEPTAAALAYGFQKVEEETLLVFDLGGGTLDVSVLEIGDDVFEVLATHGDNHLGGDNFDQAIVDFLVEKFKQENGINLEADPSAMQRLYADAEAAKIELSITPKATITLPFLSANEDGPIHFETTISRSEVEELCSDLLERIVEPTMAAIAEAEKKSGSIDHVILVGGMTRMKAVQEKVEQLTGKKAHQGVNPDEAVAVGAAIQAGVMLGQVEDVLLLDVIPLTLGIETKGEVMTKLIESNTTIPVKITETFTTAEDNQPSVEVHILQGEREMAKDNRSLGRVQLMGVPPAQAGIPQIEVSFEVNADGILNVSARDLGTGNQQHIEIKAASGLSDEEVEKMRQEAFVNRQQDAESRIDAEEKIACEITRDNAEKQLTDNKHLMEEDEAEAIQSAMDKLNSLLEQSSSRQQLSEARQDLLSELQQFSVRIYGDEHEFEPEMITDQQLVSSEDNTQKEAASVTQETEQQEIDWQSGDDLQDQDLIWEEDPDSDPASEEHQIIED
jgi:molecular chaperone DnaK